MARTALALLLLWLCGCECGDGGNPSGPDGDADADADADGDGDGDGDGDADGDADADSDGDGDGDADLDPCTGPDTLTVLVTALGTNWVTDEPEPTAGVGVVVDCGDVRREAPTDAAGQVVFEGLSLATMPVNVTAHHPDTDAYTVLGVASADEPLVLPLTRRPPFDFVQLSGSWSSTQDGSVGLLSIPGGGAGSFDGDDYLIGFFPGDMARLVGIEYVVDADDAASTIAFFDATFPAPDANGAGPDVEFAPATLDAASLRVTSADPLLADRARPSDDAAHRRWRRAELGAVVHDVDPAVGTYNVLGFTTAVETDGDADTLQVSWNGAAVVGQLRTLVRVGAADLRAGASAARDVAPDALGDLEVPALPGFAGVEAGATVTLGAGDLEVLRPDWAEGPLVVRVEPLAGGEPLYGQDLPAWTVVVPETVTVFHLPAPSAGRAFADVLGPADLRIVVVAGNGVDPADGVSWTAFDARLNALAE